MSYTKWRNTLIATCLRISSSVKLEKDAGWLMLASEMKLVIGYKLVISLIVWEVVRGSAKSAEHRILWVNSRE